MSEYFRVLRRIERERSSHRRSRSGLLVAAAAGDQATLPAEIASPAPPVEPTPVTDLSPAAGAAFATLLDNLRALATGRVLRHVVFAPASPTDSVRTITSGLAAHAERLGLTVLVAELTEWRTRPILRVRVDESGKLAGAGDPLPLDLHGTDDLAEVTEWLQSTAAEANLVLIEGQPLSEAIDSALLARACDGLVIVAETLVTSRQALQTAAERARIAGCNTFGIVTYGTNNRMPAWLRSLTGHPGSPLILPPRES